MNRPFRFVCVAAALVLLAGCGNKGPLVLPSAVPEPVEPAAAPMDPATPAPEAEDGTTDAAADPTADPTAPPADTPPETPAGDNGNA